jgi:broad specificity phosphatase PhoE
MPRWVFLRHGESEANRIRCVTGQSDSPLTDVGREQAAAAGEALADQPFQRALSSDLSRARDTARIVLSGREVALEETPLLAERGVGTFSGRNLDALRDTGENQLLLGWNTRPPDGESMAEVALRVLPFLASLEPVEGPVLVVAHGGVLRIVVGALDGLDLSDRARWKVRNCEPMIRDLGPDTFRKLVAEQGPQLFPPGDVHV